MSGVDDNVVGEDGMKLWGSDDEELYADDEEEGEGGYVIAPRFCCIFPVSFFSSSFPLPHHVREIHGSAEQPRAYERLSDALILTFDETEWALNKEGCLEVAAVQQQQVVARQVLLRMQLRQEKKRCSCLGWRSLKIQSSPWTLQHT